MEYFAFAFEQGCTGQIKYTVKRLLLIIRLVFSACALLAGKRNEKITKSKSTLYLYIFFSFNLKTVLIVLSYYYIAFARPLTPVPACTGITSLPPLSTAPSPSPSILFRHALPVSLLLICIRLMGSFIGSHKKKEGGSYKENLSVPLHRGDE